MKVKMNGSSVVEFRGEQYHRVTPPAQCSILEESRKHMSSLSLPKGQLYLVGFQSSVHMSNGIEPRWKALLAKKPRGKGVCALSSSHIGWCDEDDQVRLRRLITQTTPAKVESDEGEARFLNRLDHRGARGGNEGHRPVAAQFPRTR